MAGSRTLRAGLRLAGPEEVEMNKEQGLIVSLPG